MSRAAKAVPMCCVSIGYNDYLMPASVGMKVVELMQNAIECDETYEGMHHVFVAKDAPTVTFKSVKPNQVILGKANDVGAGESGSPLALTHSRSR